MQKTISLQKEAYFKFINSGFAMEERELIGELLQGIKTEVVSFGLAKEVYHTFPYNVTVAYDSGITIPPSLVLCGEEDKVGEVERMIIVNEERVKNSPQKRYVGN